MRKAPDSDGSRGTLGDLSIPPGWHGIEERLVVNWISPLESQVQKRDLWGTLFLGRELESFFPLLFEKQYAKHKNEKIHFGFFSHWLIPRINRRKERRGIAISFLYPCPKYEDLQILHVGCRVYIIRYISIMCQILDTGTQHFNSQENARILEG